MPPTQNNRDRSQKWKISFQYINSQNRMKNLSSVDLRGNVAEIIWEKFVDIDIFLFVIIEHFFFLNDHQYTPTFLIYTFTNTHVKTIIASNFWPSSSSYPPKLNRLRIQSTFIQLVSLICCDSNNHTFGLLVYRLLSYRLLSDCGFTDLLRPSLNF